MQSNVSSGKIIFKFPTIIHSDFSSSKHLEKLSKKTQENKYIQKVNFLDNSFAK